MPLYDYHCRKCGETFEVIQKFSDPPLTAHETCGGELEKLLSPPALQFKGSGWYVTDYARGGKSASSNGNSESKTGNKTESKTESKPQPAKSSSET